jgi:hypothetical protein
LVFFAVNLVLATWIKFDSRATAGVVTGILALSLLFIARLLAFWAPHLFSNSLSDDTLRAHVLQLGEDTGMPFAWHRVPKECEIPLVRSPVSCEHFC